MHSNGPSGDNAARPFIADYVIGQVASFEPGLSQVADNLGRNNSRLEEMWGIVSVGRSLSHGDSLKQTWAVPNSWTLTIIGDEG